MIETDGASALAMSAATITMRAALASGRVTYTDSWIRDGLFYLCNNHVLLAVFLAHPEHPYGRLQRGLVLLDSLAFAFFITAVLHSLIPLEMARSALHVTLGTLLQLAFDVPSSMLGTCPCAHRALPDFLQGCCRGVALVCLSVHTCASLIFALLGAGLLAFVGMLGGTNGDVVWHGFVETKLNAFAAALPTAVLMYALVRKCEAGGPREVVAAPSGIMV